MSTLEGLFDNGGNGKNGRTEVDELVMWLELRDLCGGELGERWVGSGGRLWGMIPALEGRYRGVCWEWWGEEGGIGNFVFDVRVSGLEGVLGAIEMRSMLLMGRLQGCGA